MKKYYILFNPHAKNETGKQEAEKLKDIFKDEIIDSCDITEVSYPDFFSKIEDDAIVVIVGGDGTINRFVNDTIDIDVKNDIYYYAAGTGNDFMADIGKNVGCEPFCINEYLKDLPTVEINGKTFKFFNGIGYGIDGYCCEVADKIRGTTDKPINYTSIAIKGLLFHYKPKNAIITVDDKEYKFKKVWLAPTMNGRYYGGGMNIVPNQDRLSKEKTISVGVLHGSGKIKTLMIFPSIFKGEHIKYEKYFKVFEGKEISVEFDQPTALQIDGETVLGVTKYIAKSASLVPEKETIV